MLLFSITIKLDLGKLSILEKKVFGSELKALKPKFKKDLTLVISISNFSPINRKR